MTRQDKINLARFGCTLDARKKRLCLRWAEADRDQVLSAAILVRTVYAKCSAGPLLCLALEMSVTHAFAHYCYFPFNLKIRGHKNYLAALAEAGRLQFCLLAPGRTIAREHQLTSAEYRLFKERYAQAFEAVATGDTAYRFAEAVAEFESKTRVAQFFERVISDIELSDVLRSVKAEAEKVAPEKRALARQIVRGFADIAKNRYSEEIRKQIEKLSIARAGVLILLDLQREFGDDYDRVVEFFADALATTTEDTALRKAADWPSKLESILKLIDRAGSAPQAEQEKVRCDVSEAVGRAFNYLQSGRGPSLSMFQNLLFSLRPLLTGQAGRPPKDYSREYGWKASKLSWTEVARMHLTENIEAQTEFGTNSFADLSFEQQEVLKHRIREGVKSYAQRSAKPFPIP